jgi:hypothetical protein
MVGRSIMDYIEDDPIEWNEESEPHAVGGGFFVYAEDVDWEAGQLSIDIAELNLGDLEHLFWDADEHLASMFPQPWFQGTLTGMCYPWGVIEMLQPSVEIQFGTGSSQVPLGARVGRPRTWNWEGALTHLLGLAQHPDGLPTGAGAQARIEELIAEWFVETTGNSPAPSQIRNWAQKVMRALKTPET